MMAFVVRAPGRVNLIGEHTDYSGGLVLPAAIDRFVTLEAEPGGKAITLASEGYDDVVDLPADGSGPALQGWGRYVAAVAAELDALGRPPIGLRGTVRSDLPSGAGLSSSAALEVAVAVALCRAAGFSLEPLAIAKAAQRAEHRAVQVPSGIMDQAASLLGRAGHALLLNCATLDYRHVPLPEELALVVLDSGIRRELESSGYAQRRAELEEALAALDGASPADLDVDEAVHRARAAGIGDVPVRRLRHVASENARVRAADTALAAGDRRALGDLFAESHASMRDDFEITTPELDLLVDLARRAGAVAARMTGGGFGGAVLALVDVADAAGLGPRVVEAYGERTGRAAKELVCLPADGAMPR